MVYKHNKLIEDQENNMSILEKYSAALKNKDEAL